MADTGQRTVDALLIVDAARLVDDKLMIPIGVVEDFLHSLVEIEGCSPPPDYRFDKELCPELAALYLAMGMTIEPSEGSHADG